MNDIAIINRNSWELAAISMISKGRSIEPYSTTQVRKIMNASQSSDYSSRIPKILQDYRPAPPQGIRGNERRAQQEMQTKREKNKIFGERLITMIHEHDALYVQRLLKYTIWNIKIIEKNLGRDMNKIALLLECEGVENIEHIRNELNRLVDSMSGQTRNHSKENNRFDNKDRRRR